MKIPHSLMAATLALSGLAMAQDNYPSKAITLTVRVPATALPRSPAVLSLDLCAVIEELDGHLSYWALHHPAAHADFHHRDGRTLRLAAPLS